MSDVPIIAGATVWVSSGALYVDLVRRLNDTDGTATFDVIGPDGTKVAADQAMIWDADSQLYVGRWDTPATIPGEYTAIVNWDALDGAKLIGTALFDVEPNPGEPTP